jgi:isopenicillin-N epimerase
MAVDYNGLEAGVTRRGFSRLMGVGGLAALVDPQTLVREQVTRLGAAPSAPDEAYWRKVRSQFAMPADLVVVNAANLCPSSTPVSIRVSAATYLVDRDPSMPNRRKLTEGKEETRRKLASFLRVTPEEIVITRNTSEGNNFVSSGIDLKAGDEVLLSAENHPSLLSAWEEKARRFGFSVRRVPQVSPHPGPDYYVDAFSKAITSKTRVLAFTHVTASAGDVYPARELCRLARERGVLSVVDGAQSFGILDIDLSDIQPDFFTGSAHKWPCGPRECGVLYINKAAESRIWPSVISLYAGAVGSSKRFEGLGQRNEAGIVGFGEALALQTTIGIRAIEDRGRELAAALIEGLRRIDGVTMWTHPDPSRSAAIVTFQPGSLDPARLAAALYEKDRIACSARTGQDRPGLRLSPHFYNLHSEIDRVIATMKRYMASGV